jgi:hypothetical protein
MAPDQHPDPIALALDVAAILERLGIPYLVGGSLASSIHGELRSTNDVDFVADVRPSHIAPLLQALLEEFYVSEEAMREALRFGTSFNAIHLPTAVKVDVFIAGGDPFNAERLEHRQRVLVRADPPGELFLDTAEHSVLRKLEWYRRGGEVSDRQWRDVLGVLRAKGEQLDAARLDTWAQRLGVADLLERARAEAGGAP